MEESNINLEEDSSINLEEDSSINLEEDSSINLEEDSSINLEEDSSINLEEESSINLENSETNSNKEKSKIDFTLDNTQTINEEELESSNSYNCKQMEYNYSDYENKIINNNNLDLSEVYPSNYSHYRIIFSKPNSKYVKKKKKDDVKYWKVRSDITRPWFI